MASSAASVTFSSIPGTYQDLCLVTSFRTTDLPAFNGSTYVRFNSLSTNIYSGTLLRGDGASATSGRVSNQNFSYLAADNDTAGNTTNTFNNNELYIPNYTGSTQKPASVFSVAENNTTTGYVDVLSTLANLTSAITDLYIYPTSGNFVTNSTFYLYGINK